MKIFQNDWAPLLEAEMQKDYYQKLRTILIKEYKTRTIYPDMYDIFNAMHYTPYDKVKVVILGQDPYHGPRQAHGLSFSVLPGVDAPPSLVNIFKELESDLGCRVPNHGCLKHWAEQGVLLLNTVLTVREYQANSHQGIGWEEFTDHIITLLNQRKEPMVFILWGRPAQRKQSMITNPDHLVITSPHPSPLSAYRGFFGSRPFSKANEFLAKHGMAPIDWQLPMEEEISK
ncbi:MAG: uracil-DNA glycosylase [Selenomonadales bacterium]|jgi:uracil-DNA glycosylase|nr:uracil-DNA glycosylase [Selenomonadales bacterium]MBQ5587864.1 uracil-DNA glycosylase [Selenomonadales bacterium]MBQ5636439.1 uracil-DNA glycosylase [Selenomonadales bacterium]MBQ5746227.1 uracil-DNA glycosylase [Selenomonadales bacterium]MBQ5832492.1 uracil-DNA glycosylase [Selenomonadales bacterium]